MNVLTRGLYWAEFMKYFHTLILHGSNPYDAMLYAHAEDADERRGDHVISEFLAYAAFKDLSDRSMHINGESMNEMRLLNTEKITSKY